MKKLIKIFMAFAFLMITKSFVAGNPQPKYIQNAGVKRNAPVTTAPQMIANPGEIIIVPITVNEFSNIGAISLTLLFDPEVLSYQTFTNTSGFPGLFAFNPVPGTITISGFNSLPAGFSLNGSSTLLSLGFTYITGSSGLIWYDDGASCEYAGPLPFYEPLTDIPTHDFFINGSVTSGLQILQGKVTYHHYSGEVTPLENIEISLNTIENLSLATTITNDSGNYSFTFVPQGTERFVVTSPMPWAGVNATDALAIQQRSVAIPLNFWNPEAFIDEVADVNQSGTINATDALNVMLRTVGLATSFNSGDWAFYADGVNFSNTSVNSAWMLYNNQSEIDIEALCYGDVNGSYELQAKRSNLQIAGKNIIELNSNPLLKLPVTFESNEQISAFTIFLRYDKQSVVVHELTAHIPGLVHKVNEGCIKVAWFDLMPLQPEYDGTIFTLEIEAIGKGSQNDALFTLDDQSAFAGVYGEPLNDVHVNIPGIRQDFKVADFTSADDVEVKVFPNPFVDLANIRYIISENARVTISIASISGYRITQLLDEYREAETNTIQFMPGKFGLQGGIYLINITIAGSNLCCTKTIPVVFIEKFN